MAVYRYFMCRSSYTLSVGNGAPVQSQRNELSLRVTLGLDL